MTHHTLSGHTLHEGVFDPDYLAELRIQIRKSRYFTQNNLNRDFVGTRGFSVVFHRAALPRAQAEFPWSAPFLERALRADCNAFYFNPLQLTAGSHVAPHIDRSLRAYVLDVDPPLQVSVLYVEVPKAMRGGDLVLRRGRKFLGRVTPREGLLVQFDGDLEHGVDRVETPGQRLSLVCEQYLLDQDELGQVPEYAIESRAKAY
ncbi:MAG TPA: 2OG-Fe(II) oxygenase [Planctomycetota bacterium]|nr:2OG-Fe(II) oxygenase [Planctomycetota bacterium]